MAESEVGIPRLTKYEMGLPGPVRRSADGQTWEPDPLLMDERFISVHVNVKKATVAQAIASGAVEVEGDTGSVEALFGMLDDFSMQFEVVAPRKDAL
jgi:alkyl sulfatase BDS1-like metallo-beta-lactamase superfamily hydrolase